MPSTVAGIPVVPTNREWMAACHAVRALRGGAHVLEGAKR
jgi:hypothetical protein